MLTRAVHGARLRSCAAYSTAAAAPGLSPLIFIHFQPMISIISIVVDNFLWEPWLGAVKSAAGLAAAFPLPLPRARPAASFPLIFIVIESPNNT